MIKAIETEYNGYRFRSRLEARWAVFFDCCGVDWEYEPEGYELYSGYNYLPDFNMKRKDSDMWNDHFSTIREAEVLLPIGIKSNEYIKQRRTKQ